MDLLFQLQQRQEEMRRLCVIWRKALASFPEDHVLPAWEPDEDDLVRTEADLQHDFVAFEEQVEEDSEDESENIHDDDLDWGLIEGMDALDLVDACV